MDNSELEALQANAELAVALLKRMEPRDFQKEFILKKMWHYAYLNSLTK